MMGILRAESRQEHPRRVRSPGATSVLIVVEAFPLAEIDPSVPRNHPRRDPEAREEDVGAVGAPLPFPVLQDDDIPVGLLPWEDLGIPGDAKNPKPSLGVKVDRDRSLDDRVGGEELDLESRRQFQKLPFNLGVVTFRIQRRRVLGRPGKSDGRQEAQQDGNDEPHDPGTPAGFGDLHGRTQGFLMIRE
jgi:hypothetical protein